jgi:hypothetical protein
MGSIAWSVHQFPMFSVAGTKWCGNSDIAKTYFDLGREKEVDKCCRTHDLCPVKVQPYRTRYNLTNEHFYTK